MREYDALDQEHALLMHVLHREVALLLQAYDAQQVVAGDAAEGQAQRINRVEGRRFRHLLVHQVVDVRVEFHHVVPIKLLRAIDQLQVRITLGEAQLE